MREHQGHGYESYGTQWRRSGCASSIFRGWLPRRAIRHPPVPLSHCCRTIAGAQHRATCGRKPLRPTPKGCLVKCLVGRTTGTRVQYGESSSDGSAPSFRKRGRYAGSAAVALLIHNHDVLPLAKYKPGRYPPRCALTRSGDRVISGWKGPATLRGDQPHGTAMGRVQLAGAW
jgi:hypothetical protein